MKNLNIAIIGNPNVGKTTLFNAITGNHYHVANYPGITVERKFADIIHAGVKMQFNDLPGTYSLNSKSTEEKVAIDFLLNNKIDLIVQIIDSSNLERNLQLTVQLLELDIPIIIAANMLDIAKKRNININLKLLAQNIGCPVIPTLAYSKIGLNELLLAIAEYDFAQNKQLKIDNLSYGEIIDEYLIKTKIILTKIKTGIDQFSANYFTKWPALLYLQGSIGMISLGAEQENNINQMVADVNKKCIEKNSSIGELISDYRYAISNNLIKGVISKPDNIFNNRFLSEKIDLVLTNRILGPISLLLLLYSIYQFTFWVSEYPIYLLDNLFSFLTTITDKYLAAGLLKSLLISGIINGVGGILSFTPLIFLMFFIIALLEDSGYMARIAYMLDRIFNFFGLHGNSIIPYIISGGIAGGCAVPGVMATRSIKGLKERLITILSAPFMACGAKIPVYALLIAAFFPTNKGFYMFLIVIVSWIVALIAAKLISLTVVNEPASYFIMELPPYHIPTLSQAFKSAKHRVHMYLRKAGTIILSISVLIWVAMTFPSLPIERIQYYDNLTKITQNGVEINLIANQKAQEAVKYSVAGRLGIWMEPFTKFAGFDWRTNISLIGGFLAKEVIVSSLGTAYSLGEVAVNDSVALSTKLQKDSNWNVGVGISLIIYTILYAPCVSVVVTTIRETGKIKWGVFTMVVYTAIAFIASILFYQLYLLF